MTFCGLLIIGVCGYLWYKGWLMYGVIIFATLFICFCLYGSKACREEEEANKKKKDAETRKKEDMQNSLVNSGFVVSKTFHGRYYTLYIDDVNKEIAYMNSCDYTIWYYGDIIGYKINIDEETVTETPKLTAKGKLEKDFFGSGYKVNIEGGQPGRTYTVTNGVYFIIMLKDMDTPTFTFELNNPKYCYEKLAEIEAVFKNILQQNEEEKQKTDIDKTIADKIMFGIYVTDEQKVLDVASDSVAYGKLFTGDRIAEIDGVVTDAMDKNSMTTYLNNKWSSGKSILLTVERAGTKSFVTISK